MKKQIVKYAVSVIVIAYNSEQSIKRCMDSLTAQNLDDLQIICVDDGSTDQTLSAFKNYENETIQVIQKKNGGPYSARMAGLKYAEGEYIAFVDSDDWVEPDAYSTAYAHAKKHNLKVCFFGISRDFDKQKSTRLCTGLPANTVIHRQQIESIIFPECMHNTIFSSLCNKIIRKSYLDSLAVPEQTHLKYGEDLLMLLEIYDKLDKTYYIPNGFYHYVYSSTESLSQKRNPNFFEEVVIPLYRSRKKYAKKWGRICRDQYYLGFLICALSELSFSLKERGLRQSVALFLRNPEFKACIRNVKMKDCIEPKLTKKKRMMIRMLKLLA